MNILLPIWLSRRDRITQVVSLAPTRYSEDIDLVQINAEPIKETYDHIRDALAFLGEPKVKQKKHNNTLIFRLESESIPVVPIHLKVEINCKEHFSVLPMQRMPFSVVNKWYNGKCDV